MTDQRAGAVSLRAGAEDFRELMSSFPTGVSVVTGAGTDGTPFGLTCTSLCSVSAAPPTLLVCLNRAGATCEAVRARGAFVVNLLDADRGREAAEAFARSGNGGFGAVRWARTPNLGLPRLVEAAQAVVECTVDRSFDAGTHSIVIGRVRDIELTGRAPLLYGRRRYGRWAEEGPH